MATNSILVQRGASRRELFTGAYVWLWPFMVIYFARPEDWIPGLAFVPLAKVTGILAVLALLLAIGNVRRGLPRETIYLILLLAQLWLCVPFSPVWRGGAFQNSLEFSKVLPIVIVMALTVTSANRLRRLLYVQCISVAIIAAAAVWKGHFVEGRLEGALQGHYANPNDLALSIVITLPLCLVFCFCSRNRLLKLVWALAILVMTYTVFLTGSRAGLVCLVVATTMCLWEFAVRGRRRYLLVIVGVAGVVFWLYAGSLVKNRLDATFQIRGEEMKGAYDSAQQRWDLLVESLKVTAHHPLFGVGMGNFTVVSGNWHVAHNSYTQMSSEGGVLALTLYLLIFWRGFKNLRASKRMAKSREVNFLARGLQASLLAYVVGAWFASETYQFFPYILVAYTTALYQIAATQATASAPERTVCDNPVEAALPEGRIGRSLVSAKVL